MRRVELLEISLRAGFDIIGQNLTLFGPVMCAAETILEIHSLIRAKTKFDSTFA